MVSSSSPPKNTAKPTITGTAKVGEELTADPGTWSGGPDRFSYQWQRCDSAGAGCVDVSGATGKTYGIRSADAQHRLRVAVQASNAAGSTTATSNPTDIVVSGTPAARNQRPTIKLISLRRVGIRIDTRFRVCDDSRKNLTIIETDSRPGQLSYTRRFSTRQPPLNCGVYTRSWTPAPRFRGHGRYTVTLRARDKSGLTSLPTRRTLVI